jgi:uncharacterized protein DUF6614
MDYYLIWCNLKDTSRDLEFCEDVARYLGYLREQGKIEGFRITRRKLGFGPPEMGEFNITIEVRDLAQLEQAFQRVATRDGDVEPLHRAVFSAVKDLSLGLYRDFPDRVRESLAAEDAEDAEATQRRTLGTADRRR